MSGRDELRSRHIVSDEEVRFFEKHSKRELFELVREYARRAAGTFDNPMADVAWLKEATDKLRTLKGQRFTEETAVDALCECEHESHTSKSAEHMYGTVRALWRAQTMFGSFAVCARCRNDKHME